MNIKHFYLLIVLIIVACLYVQFANKPKATLASAYEVSVINFMNCWESVSGENQMNLVVFENDEKKRSKMMDKWHEYNEEARVFGRKALANDSIFISCIRADSVYKSILKNRLSIATSLNRYRKSIPIFSDMMDDIRNQIIEYNYFDGTGLGLYSDSYVKESLFNKKDFYYSLGDLFRKAYIKDSTVDITDNEIVTIDSLLLCIDKIDRHIWAVPYYFNSKRKFDEDNRKLDMEKRKQLKLYRLSK